MRLTGLVLLALAKDPNVAVKASGAPSYSSEPYPFRNIHGYLQQIYDAFGPERMFWGTDISRMHCSWCQCVTMFTEEPTWLPEKEKEVVMWDALFATGWAGSSPSECARNGLGIPVDMRFLSTRSDLLFNRLVVALSTALAVSVLAAACTNSNNGGSASPLVTQDVVASEVAEPQPLNDKAVFLRVIAPLDEARGYCLDIPGHLSSVQIDSPLQVHTCKHGIWNQDGRFDAAALESGVLSMPHYELCLQAEDTTIGARLFLATCTEVELQTWTLQDTGQIVLKAFPEGCITVAERPGRDAGGPRYRMNGVGLDTCAQQANDRQRWTTVKPR